MKTTKGEWYENQGTVISMETGKTLAVIPYYDKDNEEEVANAKIMAASKELFKACKAAVVALDMHDKFGENIDARHAAEEDAFNKLNWAIQKARF